jgi:hypothetical protein
MLIGDARFPRLCWRESSGHFMTPVERADSRRYCLPESLRTQAINVETPKQGMTVRGGKISNRDILNLPL